MCLLLAACVARAESIPTGRFVESSTPPYAELDLAKAGEERWAGRLVLREQMHDGIHEILRADLEIALDAKGRMTLRSRDGSPERAYPRVESTGGSLRFERSAPSADASRIEREAWTFAPEGENRIVLFRETVGCDPSGTKCSPPAPMSFVLDRKGSP